MDNLLRFVIFFCFFYTDCADGTKPRKNYQFFCCCFTEVGFSSPKSLFIGNHLFRIILFSNHVLLCVFTSFHSPNKTKILYILLCFVVVVVVLSYNLYWFGAVSALVISFGCNIHIRLLINVGFLGVINIFYFTLFCL